MTGAFSPSHWVILLVVVLLLFGAKRLPDMARGLGSSMRIFKAETAALSAENKADGTGSDAAAAAQPAVTSPPATAAPAATPEPARSSGTAA